MASSTVTLSEEAPEVFEQVLGYVFDEYNHNKNGVITRKEFFTFLWELKQNAKQSLNEGQMMSCWLQVSNKKDAITIEEFKEGLELCYEHQFFAQENGATPPVFCFGSGEDASSYNTVKFKKSLGVAAFNKILEDESRYREEKQTRPMTLYGKEAAASGATATNSEAMVESEPLMTEKSEGSYRPDRTYMGESGAVEDMESMGANRNDSMRNSMMQEVKAPLPAAPINNIHTQRLQLQKEREQKKMEAQKKMDQIMAQRYQEQKKQREEERKKMEEDKKNQREAEVQQIVSEPAWMQALKNKKQQTQPTSTYRRF